MCLSLIRYDIKESETKLRDLTLDFQTVVKERDKLKQLASLQEGIQDGLKQEAKDRQTKLKVFVLVLKPSYC